MQALTPQEHIQAAVRPARARAAVGVEAVDAAAGGRVCRNAVERDEDRTSVCGAKEAPGVAREEGVKHLPKTGAAVPPLRQLHKHQRALLAKVGAVCENARKASKLRRMSYLQAEDRLDMMWGKRARGA